MVLVVVRLIMIMITDCSWCPILWSYRRMHLSHSLTCTHAPPSTQWRTHICTHSMHTHTHHTACTHTHTHTFTTYLTQTYTTHLHTHTKRMHTPHLHTSHAHTNTHTFLPSQLTHFFSKSSSVIKWLVTVASWTVTCYMMNCSGDHCVWPCARN